MVGLASVKMELARKGFAPSPHFTWRTLFASHDTGAHCCQPRPANTIFELLALPQWRWQKRRWQRRFPDVPGLETHQAGSPVSAALRLEEIQLIQPPVSAASRLEEIQLNQPPVSAASRLEEIQLIPVSASAGLHHWQYDFTLQNEGRPDRPSDLALANASPKATHSAQGRAKFCKKNAVCYFRLLVRS